MFVSLILSAVSRLIAPVLSFTAEEIWKYMPHPATDDKRSIMMNDMPSAINVQVDSAFTEKWDMIYNLRSDVTKALEAKRAEILALQAREERCQDRCYRNQ